MIARPIMISRYSCARRKMMIPFSISAMTSVPKSAPMAVPRPPVRLAPPTTAAAITVSSYPVPVLVEAVPKRPKETIPPIPAANPANA